LTLRFSDEFKFDFNKRDWRQLRDTPTNKVTIILYHRKILAKHLCRLKWSDIPLIILTP